MIQYIEHKNIDKKKWDECIQTSTAPSIFVYSWYLDVVCPTWNALILNDYEAVFPLASNSKLSIPYLYQPLFTRYLGVYSKVDSSENLVSNFFNAIPKQFKYIEFSIHERNIFNRIDFEKKERLFQTLSLMQSYDQLLDSFKGDAKRNIKKAEKQLLTITENVKPKDVVDLFKNNKGKELKGLTKEDYQTLENLMKKALQNNAGIVIGVHNQEKNLIAAGFFIKSANEILFLKGSANSEGKTVGAMYLLLNYIFKNYCLKIETFDFGGSSVESVASFNHNFGAKDSVYLQVKRNKLPYLIKLMSGKK
jgi:hypothetical protein